MKLKFPNPLLKLSTAISTYLLASSAHAAAGSASDLSSVSNLVGSQIYQVSDMISTASYVAGAAFGMAGVMKLKAHAENPGQTPISQGAGRLAAGGALVALPWVISDAVNTIGGANTSGVDGIAGSTFRF